MLSVFIFIRVFIVLCKDHVHKLLERGICPYTSASQSTIERSQSRNSRQNHRGCTSVEVIVECCFTCQSPMILSTCFLIVTTSTIGTVLELPTLCWVFSHQSSVKEINHRLVQMPIYLVGTLSQSKFPFPTLLCLVLS